MADKQFKRTGHYGTDTEVGSGQPGGVAVREPPRPAVEATTPVLNLVLASFFLFYILPNRDLWEEV
jgi:hypothetical protein